MKSPLQTNFEKQALNSRIGDGVLLNGVLTFETGIIIRGEFKGQINGGDLLIIDNDARVDAKINVDTLIVRGVLEGEVMARELVILESSSVVQANIHTKNIRIAENAEYQGECVVSSENESVEQLSTYSNKKIERSVS